MSTDLETQPSPQALTLFGSNEPNAIVYAATEHATALADVIKAKGLYVNISGRSFVKVDGWTLCGSMCGVFPVVVWSRKVWDEAAETHLGWEARVEARTRNGDLVGAAESQCLRSEKEWGPNPTRGKMRDDYALRSMAQTRAVSKALRLPLGFIVALAGYEATPADEMPSEASA